MMEALIPSDPVVAAFLFVLGLMVGFLWMNW